MPATRSGRGFRESSAKCVELDMMLEQRIKQERDDCPAEMRVEMCGPLASRCDHEVPRRGSRAQFLDQKTADNMIWINCCPPLPSHRGATWRGGARSCELCAASVLHDLVPARYQLPKLTAETVRCIGNWRRESVRPVCCELLWRQLTVRSDRFC